MRLPARAPPSVLALEERRNEVEAVEGEAEVLEARLPAEEEKVGDVGSAGEPG
jgi:hypothetical protein